MVETLKTLAKKIARGLNKNFKKEKFDVKKGATIGFNYREREEGVKRFVRNKISSLKPAFFIFREATKGAEHIATIAGNEKDEYLLLGVHNPEKVNNYIRKKVYKFKTGDTFERESLTPMEDRYCTEETRAVFGLNNKFKKWLEVEAALAKAQAEILEEFPKYAAEEISRKANLTDVTIKRIKKIEKTRKHELASLTFALSEACNEKSAAYVHYGATSNDIIEPALIMVLRDGVKALIRNATILVKSLGKRAKEAKKYVMTGRTHGQHAIPQKFGVVLAEWVETLQDNIKYLEETLGHLDYGKMKGAIGTGASFGEHAEEIEKKTLAYLGLKSRKTSSQIIPRNVHLHVVSTVGNMARTLENIAYNLWLLAQEDTGEIKPPFSSKQVGSSTMAQKVNPWRFENIQSLSRMVNAMVAPMSESVRSPHQGDMSHSAAERFIFPINIGLTHFMIKRMTFLIDNFIIDKDRMLENLERTQGRIMSEAVITAIIRKGTKMNREQVHTLIKDCAMESKKKRKPLTDVLKANEKVPLTSEEINFVMQPQHYTGRCEELAEAAARDSEISEIGKSVENTLEKL